MSNGLRITTDWDRLKIPSGQTVPSHTVKSLSVKKDLQTKKPKSEVHIVRSSDRRAQHDWKNIVSPVELKTIREKTYAVSTVVDTVVADSAKGPLEWRPYDPKTEPSPESKLAVAKADKLLYRPNHKMTFQDLRKAVRDDLETYSDAYIEVVWDELVDPTSGSVVGRQPGQLWPVPAGEVEICPVDDHGTLPPSSGPEKAYAYTQKVKGKIVAQFYADEIIHIQANNINSRLYGTPKLLSVLMIIATQQEAIRYNYKTFSGEKVPRQIVLLDTNADELERMLLDTQKRLDEDPKAVEFLAGHSGEVLKLMESMRDMEFMELLKFLERCICARWRLPPVAIGISEAGGAGIIVGETQSEKYWDMIDEGNQQFAESLSSWSQATYGFSDQYISFPSQRPRREKELAELEDVRVRNNTLTVNEARRDRGLPPVAWGDGPFSAMNQPATPPGIALFHAGQTSSPTTPPGDANISGGVAWHKGVSPARMDHGPIVQLDPVAEKRTVAFAGRLNGLFLEMRRELLKLTKKDNIIVARKAKKAQGISQEALLDEARTIADKYFKLMDQASKEELLEAYLGCKAETALQTQTFFGGWSKADLDRLSALQTAWAATSIRTFTADQVKVIEESLAQVADKPSLTTFRNLVEGALGKNLWEEQWKLDRIARTSLGRVAEHARGQQFRDVTKNDDPDVEWASPMDPPRARPEHMALHRTTMKLSAALAEKDRAINCRCTINLALKLPEGVPRPDDLVADITAARHEAEALAREQYLGVE